MLYYKFSEQCVLGNSHENYLKKNVHADLDKNLIIL